MESKEANIHTTNDQFTATSSKGICILLVKDDTACNNIVSDMLQHCSYEVLKSGGALDVVNAIWDVKDGLELVLTNIHKLGFNGIEIARSLQKKFHLPIVLMSPDKKKIDNGKGESFRIAAYVLNGLSRSDVGSLWQRACRKEGEKTACCNNAVENKREDSLSVDETMFHDRRRGKKREESVDDYERRRFSDEAEHGRSKKPRVVWTAEMHRRFLEAIHILGHDKAVPKKIVQVMNTPGLTRENVASHLQKYRGGLKRSAQEITLTSLSDTFRTTMDEPFHVSLCRYSQTQCFTMQIPYDSNNARLIKAKHDYCYSLRSVLDSSRSYPKYRFSRFNDQRKTEKLPHIYDPTDHNPSGEFNFVGIRLASDGNSIKFGKLEMDFSAPQASGDHVITTGCVQQSATLDQKSSVTENQSAQWIPRNETVSSIDLSQDYLSLLMWEIENSSPGQDISGEALKTNEKDHIPLRDSPEKETGFDDLSIPELIFPSDNDFLPKAIEAHMDDFRVLLQDDMSQQQPHHSPSQMLQVTSDFVEQSEVDDSLINTMLSTSSPEFHWEEFCGTIFNNDS